MKREKSGVGHILKSYCATFFIGHSLFHRQKKEKRATLSSGCFQDTLLMFSGRRRLRPGGAGVPGPTVLTKLSLFLGAAGGNYWKLSTLFIHSLNKYLLNVFHMPTF